MTEKEEPIVVVGLPVSTDNYQHINKSTLVPSPSFTLQPQKQDYPEQMKNPRKFRLFLMIMVSILNGTLGGYCIAYSN